MFDEISLVLKQMKNNKCPWVGGFPLEFFKIFYYYYYYYFLLKRLNYAYNTDEMTLSGAMSA